MHFIRRPYFPLKYTEKLSFEVHSVTDFGRRIQTTVNMCKPIPSWSSLCQNQTKLVIKM